MRYDPQYLGRNLNDRVKDTAERFRHEILAIVSHAAQHGAINSSRVYIQFWQKGIEVLRLSISEAAQFAYNLTGNHSGEVYDQVAHCAKRVVDEMMIAISERAGHAIDRDGVVAKTRVAFEELRDRLLDDFKNGMMGSERLKKDPVVNIIANQTNSPGAVQQVGVGDFSQTAFVQNHRALIDTINAALASNEFAGLTQQQKDGFADVANVLKDEASRSAPDPGRLKRWGQRLVEIAVEVGMKTTAEKLVPILGAMFGG